jgi:hypothetical protein
MLLKQQSATAPVDLPRLLEIAEVINPANSNGESGWMNLTKVHSKVQAKR